MELQKTSRNFSIAEFSDLYGSKCSLQKSSLATDDAIWLGVDLPFNGQVGVRMHLNREQLAELLPYLQRFVETGELSE